MKIGKYVIIKNEEYFNLKKDSKDWKERTNIITDNKIQQKKEELRKKYKKYIGKSYMHPEEGIVFTIDDIYYNSNNSYSFSFEDRFMFSTGAKNNPNWDWEVSIQSIINGEFEECSV